MTQRRIYWDKLAYDIVDNIGPLTERPAEATYHSTLTKDRSERHTYWAADLDIGDIKEIMIAEQYYVVLCGNGAPYYLMFKEEE